MQAILDLGILSVCIPIWSILGRFQMFILFCKILQAGALSPFGAPNLKTGISVA